MKCKIKCLLGIVLCAGLLGFLSQPVVWAEDENTEGKIETPLHPRPEPDRPSSDKPKPASGKGNKWQKIFDQLTGNNQPDDDDLWTSGPGAVNPDDYQKVDLPGDPEGFRGKPEPYSAPDPDAMADPDATADDGDNDDEDGKADKDGNGEDDDDEEDSGPKDPSGTGTDSDATADEGDYDEALDQLDGIEDALDAWIAKYCFDESPKGDDAPDADKPDVPEDTPTGDGGASTDTGGGEDD